MPNEISLAESLFPSMEGEISKGEPVQHASGQLSPGTPVSSTSSRKSETDSFAESIYTTMATEDPEQPKSGFEGPNKKFEASQAISEDDLSTMSEELGFTEEETAWIKENGFSKSQVEQVVEKAREIERESTEANVERLQEFSDAWKAESEAQFSEAEIEDYADAVTGAADEETIAMLKVMGLANHPGFIRLINNLINR